MSPIFGITYTVEEKPLSLEKLTAARKDDDIEITGGDGEAMDTLGMYCI